MKSGLVVALLLAIVTALFAVQNSQNTQISFVHWQFDGPLVVVLLITFLSGVITALLVTIPGSVSKTMEISRLKWELAAAATLAKTVTAPAPVVVTEPAANALQADVSEPSST